MGEKEKKRTMREKKERKHFTILKKIFEIIKNFISNLEKLRVIS